MIKLNVPYTNNGEQFVVKIIPYPFRLVSLTIKLVNEPCILGNERFKIVGTPCKITLREAENATLVDFKCQNCRYFHSVLNDKALGIPVLNNHCGYLHIISHHAENYLPFVLDCKKYVPLSEKDKFCNIVTNSTKEKIIKLIDGMQLSADGITSIDEQVKPLFEVGECEFSTSVMNEKRFNAVFSEIDKGTITVVDNFTALLPENLKNKGCGRKGVPRSLTVPAIEFDYDYYIYTLCETSTHTAFVLSDYDIGVFAFIDTIYLIKR